MWNTDEIVAALENNPNHLENLKVCEIDDNVLLSMKRETFEVIKYALKRYVELTKEKLEMD